MTLARLLEQAHIGNFPQAQQAHARLIALAPNMAQLLIDAVQRHPEDKWLVARFAELNARAGADGGTA